MAVYHLACRLVAEPNRPNPPARVAKWQQACALPSCLNMIWKGDMISCTRDNENGQRKGPRSTVPVPMAPRETWSSPVIAGSGTAPDEPEPPTHRDPFPMSPPSDFEQTMQQANAFANVQRELAASRAAHEKTLQQLANALHTLAAIRHAINSQEQQ